MAYCSKNATRIASTEPYIYGDFGSAQGKRQDLIDLRDAIRDGATMRELMDNDVLLPSLAKSMRFTERAMAEYTAPINRDSIYTICCLGPSGTGKTHCAIAPPPDMTPADVYMKPDGDWWEGYTGQRVVVLDEFSGRTCAPTVFQKICDKYPMNVPIKGRSASLAATHVRLTSNFLPSKWWKEGTRYQRDAVFRRINEVHYHDTINHKFVYHHTIADGEIVPTPGHTAMDKFLAGNHFMPQ